MPTTSEKEGQAAFSVFIAIRHKRTKLIDFILLSIKNDWDVLLMDVISSQSLLLSRKNLIFLMFAEIED